MDIKKELNYKETYYQGHKDAIKRTNKRYYQKHRDKILEQAKEYRLKNHDKVNAKIKCEYCNRWVIARGKNKHYKTDIHKRRGKLKYPKKYNKTQKSKNKSLTNSNNFFNDKKVEPCEDAYTLTFRN